MFLNHLIAKIDNNLHILTADEIGSKKAEWQEADTRSSLKMDMFAAMVGSNFECRLAFLDLQGLR